ncbi:unnamed protein product [Caenorhabditis nigoni]
MSKYLKIPNKTTPPKCLHQEALRYILRECKKGLESIDYQQGGRKEQEIKLIQLLIDKSNHKLRMYGSAEELLENINIYKDFPANHNFFGKCDHPHQTRPKIFTSFKNEKYIAKSDVFGILQNIVIELANERDFELILTLNYYLKTLENNVGNSMEFVRFDEKRFDELEREIREEMAKRQLSWPQKERLIKEFSKLSKTKIVEKFLKILPCSSDSQSKHDIESLFGRIISDFSVEAFDITKQMAETYSGLSCLIKSLDTVIDRNPDLVLPRSKDSKEPITLRVFEDRDQQFLMSSEVVDVLEGKYALMRMIEGENTFYTTRLEKVLKMCDTKNVEFIRYPILRAKHRATPIPRPSTEEPILACILAIDTFFQFFKELILGIKYFQKVRSFDGDLMLNVMQTVFQLHCSDLCFVPYPDESVVKEFVSNFVNLDLIPAEVISNAKPDGFTFSNLKYELSRLGLTTIFPEIIDFAGAVYSEVDKRKKGSVLRTCDLFDAVEQCQLICVLERLPELKKFVHNQKGCHRVYGLKCEACFIEEIQKLDIQDSEGPSEIH